MRPLGTSRQTLARLVSATALIGSILATTTGALAAEMQATSAETAVVLNKEMTGHLDPNSGGSFSFFKFWYDADGSTATVNLQVTPDDPAILKNVGVNIYGPDGKQYVSGGQQPGIQPNVSGNVIINDSNQKGFYTVQVFDYEQSTPIDFRIWGVGLPAQPAPAGPALPAPSVPAVGVPAAPAVPVPPVAAPAPAPAAPAPAAPAPAAPSAVGGQSSFRGHLAASSGGKFETYEFTYPGDQSVYTINLNITPDDPQVLKNAGFKVYGPTKDKVYVEGGVQQGLVPNVSGNVITIEPGTYVIQVYNYNPSAAIDYEISLVPGPPPGEVITGRANP